MSASKEKKNRIAEQDAPLSKRAAAAAEEEKKNRKFRRNTVIVIVALIIVVAAALIINSDLLYTRTSAVTVGSTSYSPADVSFFYKSAANQLYTDLYDQYGENAVYLLNLDKPLSEQLYFDGQTPWSTIALETALDNMKKVTVYCDAAEKEGFSLSEAGKTEVQNEIDQMAMFAEFNGTTLSKFLAAYFGKGMNEKRYTELVNKLSLASEYSGNMLSSLVYSDDEASAYYNEHAEKYDYHNYYAFAVNFAASQFDNVEGEKSDAAHKAAEKISAAKNVDEFIALAREFTGDDETTVSMSHNTAENISTNYRDWVTDPARKANDTTVVDSNTACYAPMYAGMDDNDYHYVDFRHILINAEADENGVYTDEAMAAAKARCEELLAEWEADPTEDHFIEMANEYSEDSGSNTNGGLYSNVVKNQMVTGVNDFLFADGRAVGDTAVVEGRSSAYAGYHLVYCSALHESLRIALGRNGMTSDAYDAKYASLLENDGGYNVVRNSAMKYANIA